jgi:cell division protein FtsI (penicillin-binding protein 3)
MSVAQILAQSSNVGAITLAEKLGPTRLYQWMRRFGFGSTTGIAFPGESRGFVLSPDEWSGSTIGNVPIGQGVAVTPVQMAAAYAMVANRGVWVQPHLVERIDGHRAARPKKRRVLRRAIAAELNAMLQNVVREGTGTLAAVPGYRVAGKTGTAHKLDGATYAPNKYVSSFIGFAPASAPRLIVAVMLDEPGAGQYYGGTVAAPVFSSVMAGSLRLLGVKPDAPLNNVVLPPPDAPEVREEV